MSDHTPEPWRVIMEGAHYTLVMEGFPEIGQILRKEDARRIVACVNACKGYDNVALEEISSIGASVLRVAQQRDQANAERDAAVLATSQAIHDRDEAVEKLQQLQFMDLVERFFRVLDSFSEFDHVPDKRLRDVARMIASVASDVNKTTIRSSLLKWMNSRTWAILDEANDWPEAVEVIMTAFDSLPKAQSTDQTEAKPVCEICDQPAVNTVGMDHPLHHLLDFRVWLEKKERENA